MSQNRTRKNLYSGDLKLYGPLHVFLSPLQLTLIRSSVSPRHPISSVSIFPDADEVKLMMHHNTTTPKGGSGTGDDISPDVQHASNGDPVYPSVLPTTGTEDNSPEDDDNNG